MRASIVGRGAVESAVTMPTNALYTASPDRIVGKTEVHELTHQWSTDIGAFPGYGDHCFPEVSYDSQGSYQVPPGAGTLYCTMSFDDPAATMVAPWSTPTSQITISAIEYQYANGSTTFHVIPQGTGWHSEYLGIRAVADPWVP